MYVEPNERNAGVKERWSAAKFKRPFPLLQHSIRARAKTTSDFGASAPSHREERTGRGPGRGESLRMFELRLRLGIYFCTLPYFNTPVMKNVVLLGSTGSIGASAIKVAEDLPDRIRLLGLAAGNNLELLLEQTRKHRPEAISITNPEKAKTARDALGTATSVVGGSEGLSKLAKLPAADLLLIALVSTGRWPHALA